MCGTNASAVRSVLLVLVLSPNGALQLVTPLALRGKAMLTEDTTLQIHDHLSMNGSTDQQKKGM